MKISIDFPDRLRNQIDERSAREAMVASLYASGRISGRDAREVLGMTRRAFEEMLPKYNVSILLDTDENIQTELNA